MLLRELIFQGVLGCDKAVRLKPEQGVSEVELPPGVAIDDVQDIIISLLYPNRLNSEQRARVCGQDGVKLAAVLEGEQGRYRVLRGAESKTLRLQVGEGGTYTDLAEGLDDVARHLQTVVQLPKYKVFLALNLWRFEESVVPSHEFSVPEEDFVDSQIPRLIEMYQVALEVEAIEDKTKDYEARLDDARHALGTGAELDARLTRAREALDEIAIPDLTKEELELLSSKDKKLDELDAQVTRLMSEEEMERRQIDRLLPETPRRQWLFWVGVLISVGSVGTSLIYHDTLRLVVLLNVLGFGVVTWVLLQYYNNLGRASVHQARLESIKRRLNQVREEQVFFHEAIYHLLYLAGVTDEEDLQDRVPEVEHLKETIAHIEAQLDKLKGDSGYRRAKKEVNELDAELKRLRQRREELPSFVMSSYQLESDLESLGVEPADVRDPKQTQKPEPSEPRVEAESEDVTPFERLRRVAQLTGQWEADALDPRTQKMWSKICGHVLNERFADVMLDAHGQLQVSGLTSEQLQMWSRTRTSDVRAVMAALALALQINADLPANGSSFRSVWINDPSEELTPGHAAKFASVFRSAAKKSHIVICKG